VTTTTLLGLLSMLREQILVVFIEYKVFFNTCLCMCFLTEPQPFPYIVQVDDHVFAFKTVYFVNEYIGIHIWAIENDINVAVCFHEYIDAID
jgi:hypothetical protein